MTQRIVSRACGACVVLIVATSVSVLCARVGHVSPQARDAAVLRTGSASLAGIVVADDGGQPARRARVDLADEASTDGSYRNAVTDDEGRFAFAGLPAGEFTLTASKPGYVTLEFGQKKPHRSGTPIQLADKQQIDGLVMRLARGGVITGSVVTDTGESAPGTPVAVMRYDMESGTKTLVSAGSDVADDRGVYRVYGLAPGEYIVSAAPKINIGDLTQTAPSAPAMNAAGAEALRAFLTPADPGEMHVAYAPVYYPGTATPAGAMAVTIGPGEERGGISFSLPLVPVAKIDGTVSGLDGAMSGISLTIVDDETQALGDRARAGIVTNTTISTAGGRFGFSRIPPGQYTIHARTGGRGAAPTSASASEAVSSVLWGVANIIVEGRNIADVAIRLQPATIVSGHVGVERSGAVEMAPLDLTRVRIALQWAGPRANELRSVPSPTVRVDRDGNFTIAGVVPGTYVVRVDEAPGGLTATSAMVGGRDAFDVPFEVRASESVAGVAVTLSDRSTELTGMLKDASGKPASDYTLIVFSADKQFWSPQSRRIQSTRPSTSGTYAFRDLPAGEYRIAVVPDVEPGEWFAPAYLTGLLGEAESITLRAGEKTTRSFVISRALMSESSEWVNGPIN